MIFSFLVKAIKAIVDGFARLCAFLLVTLGLWLPAVYSIFFLIVCAIAGIPLKGTTTTVYIIGLVISFIACVWLGIRRIDRRKAKKNESYTQKTQKNQGGGAVKRREYAPAEDVLQRPNVEVNEDFYATNEYAPTQGDLYSNSQSTPQEDRKKSAKEELYGKTKQQTTYDDFEDLKAKYLAADAGAKAEHSAPVQNNNSAATNNSAGDSTYGAALKDSGFSNNFDTPDVAPSYNFQLSDPISRQQLERRLMGVETNEKPMVFAMRSDPDIIVYEYSDRLKYYRKTKRGLIHLSTEFKK